MSPITNNKSTIHVAVAAKWYPCNNSTTSNNFKQQQQQQQQQNAYNIQLNSLKTHPLSVKWGEPPPILEGL